MNREDNIGTLVWDRLDMVLWRQMREALPDKQISKVWMLLLSATREQVEAISDCIYDALGGTLQ